MVFTFKMENLVPQPDGLYALTFKNFQKVSEDEVRDIFEKYGDVVSIRKSSEQVPWIFVRYKNYDEALKAYRDLQNCERFDIKVATSGKKSQDKGSEEKGTKGEARDKGAPKVWTNHPLRKEMELHEVVITNFDAIPTKNDIIRLCSGVTLLHVSVDVTPRNMERNNFEDHSFSENTDDVPRSKEPSKFFAGRSRNFTKNPPRETDNDDDEEVKRNQTQMTGHSRNFSKNLHREVVEGDQEAKRNHMQLAGRSRNFSTHPPKEVGDDDLEGRRNNTKLSGRGKNYSKTSPKEVNVNKRKIPVEDDWEDDEDIGVEAAGRSLKQLSMHGVVRHRKGNSEDGESDVKSSNEGPPKLVKATTFYGALTLQHPYESHIVEF
ncbi:hypothetical protein J437_LFUL010666 [Ladona fulva]|uniref:RRM domain-containing protein n=1 Tax=Ladona fulva TaxID=123851 RepID=A0A8K0K8V4_LADFU|nr:hypothetical protein J437_LFUL010666 [Ladona fulva]